jgi:hypothetical protein
MRFRVPELFLGAFLATAIFSMGILFSSTIFPPHQASEAHSDHLEEKTKKIVDAESADDRIAKYTLWLAILTGALVVVSTFQGYFLIRSDRTARIAAETARKSTETAQAEFIATHRPRIRVRNIVVNSPQSADGRTFEPFAPGQIVSGQFFIANVGGSRADILDGHCTVFWSREGLPMRRPYEGRDDNLQAMGRTLLSGQSTTALFRSDRPIESEASQTVGRSIAHGFKLYVMGWVTYADRNNDVWRTGFCHEYVPTGGFSPPRFFPVDDPDYEYQD